MNNHLPKISNPLKTEIVPFDDKVHKAACLPTLQSPWVRAAQLPELFCSWDLAYRCTRNGWLTPIVQGKRRTIYRLADVLACMQRIEAGELPLPRRIKATS